MCPRRRTPPRRRPTATTLVLIDKPGAAQSSFRLGGIGAPRSTKDYFALQVLNTILGGSFTSRLNQNLRETKGYTYGAGSGFSMRRQPGPFTASAEIVSAKTDSALIEFTKELRVHSRHRTERRAGKGEALSSARAARGLRDDGSIAGQLLPLITYDIPLDFYNTAVQSIGAVTQADVQRVARQYVDPDQAHARDRR